MHEKNKVYLVGAGPGDPDLLTIKALRLIKSADIVVYDRLVSSGILALIPESIPRIYVGKACDKHALPQSQINTLLVKLGRQYSCVVRLKGGDPYIFGRGGEEALALTSENIGFEVVPGITAAQACASYAGIPLTHRGLAQSVKYLTGHWQDNRELTLGSAGLSDVTQTLVIYMGLKNLPVIVQDLLSAGRSPETPAAIIERGSSVDQRSIITALSFLEEAVAEFSVISPAIIIVGDVVNLASQLQWFEPAYQQTYPSEQEETIYAHA